MGIDTILSLKVGNKLGLLPIALALMKLIFNFIENLIDFTSIPMGIDKNKSLKSGNRVGSVHGMGKQMMQVPLTAFILE